jgi:saccharopine dehydrogenase (NAD+, L-lysine forming)
VIWEADRGWCVTPHLNEPEVFDFPGGIGPVECMNVEHEQLHRRPS